MSIAAITRALVTAILCLVVLCDALAQDKKQAPQGTAPATAANENSAAPPGKTGQEPPTLTSPELYDKSFKALFVLFILATLLESGLAVVFNWRPFIQYFDGRGVKTLVSLAFAWFFVGAFNLDIVTRLINLYFGTNEPVSSMGLFLTALVVAGGSGAVNQLFVAFRMREPKTADKIEPKPPPSEAWLAVRLIRRNAVGPVTGLAGPDAAALPVAGTITGSSNRTGLSKLFLRDFGRLPTAGGLRVEPGKAYKVQLIGRDANGAATQSAVWGPHPLAAGAIVDIDLEL